MAERDGRGPLSEHRGRIAPENICLRLGLRGVLSVQDGVLNLATKRATWGASWEFSSGFRGTSCRGLLAVRVAGSGWEFLPANFLDLL